MPSFSETIVVDEGHGQRFSVASEGELQLSGLGMLAESSGHQIEIHKGPINNQVLLVARGLIISGPFTSYSVDEIRAIRSFAHRGGRIAIMIHVGPLNGLLLAGLGVQVSNGVLFDPQNPLGRGGREFSAHKFSHHPLFESVDSFNLYGAWALNTSASTARGIAFTGHRAWIDLHGQHNSTNNPVSSWAVVVSVEMGSGEVVVFGDDAIFQNRFLEGGNLRLAENLVKWLTGERQGPDKSQLRTALAEAAYTSRISIKNH